MIISMALSLKINIQFDGRLNSFPRAIFYEQDFMLKKHKAYPSLV